MKIVFLSNYFNHHQKDVSDALSKFCDNYFFIETEQMDRERLSMGWKIETPSYVLKNDMCKQKKQEAQQLVDDADVVIYGSAPFEMIKRRIRSGKLTFCYSERIFKQNNKLKNFLRGVKYFSRYAGSRNTYLLCASAYAASDYHRLFCFRGKAYKWGYFPTFKQYDSIDKILKSKHPASILWVARFIKWKHPEIPILLAKRLKENGYAFELNMIGNGKLEEKIQIMIRDNGVQECVHLLGSMNPDAVRRQMEQSKIFLFTSDQNEGWGAVLNEAMNSGCAVVANKSIGSVPFLISNNENGTIYDNNCLESVYETVKKLLDNDECCYQLGQAAYKTIESEWNGKMAAARVIVLAKELEKKNKPGLFLNGPCSEAK